MKNLLLLLLLTITAFSCGEDDNAQPSDNFDRQAMLTNWADNIIVPGYVAFTASTTDLQVAADAFVANPELVTLSTLRSAWETAYLDWQKVAMYEIGKA